MWISGFARIAYPGAIALCGVLVVGGSLGYYLLLVHVRAQQRHQASVSGARREGVALSIRTIRHLLANKLAVTVGYSELLAEDPRLPHELEPRAQQIKDSAMAVVEVVDRLQRDVLRVQVDKRIAGPPLLDVDASTSAAPNHPV